MGMSRRLSVLKQRLFDETFKGRLRSKMMAEPVRVPPEEVRAKVSAGEALLVCAYDDEEKFRKNHLEGGMDLGTFRSKLPTLSKDQEIYFYCA
jgi:hypothetical protein